MKDNFNIPERDFLVFDAMRQTSQCVGRVFRSKYDYGLMIFADKRYARIDKKERLPQWIRNKIEPGSVDISVDQALSIASKFFKEMGQDFEMPEELLLTSEKIQARQADWLSQQQPSQPEALPQPAQQAPNTIY